MNEQFELAIIIPAYKPRFLARALESINAQTDQRFRIYVGDDCSPHSLETIVKDTHFPDDQIIYKYFCNNLGGTSLVRQWERCINLSNEPWIWLFSDDDVMEPNCVEQFYQEMTHDKRECDLFRFNTLVIDRDDYVTDMNPKHPEWEPWNEFSYFLLQDLRRVFQQEFIFRRAEYQRIGGFLDLPLAWASDHVFAIACSRKAGVRTIGGARVYFRQSGENISSQMSVSVERVKWQAFTAYTDWLISYFVMQQTVKFPTSSALVSLVKYRYYRNLSNSKRWRSVSECRALAKYLGHRFEESNQSVFWRLIRLNMSAIRQSFGHIIRKAFANLIRRF